MIGDDWPQQCVHMQQKFNHNLQVRNGISNGKRRSTCEAMNIVEQWAGDLLTWSHKPMKEDERWLRCWMLRYGASSQRGSHLGWRMLFFSVELSMAALKGSDGCKPQAMEGYATCFSMENLNQIDEQMRLSSSFLSAKLFCVFPKKKFSGQGLCSLFSFYWF